LLLLKFVQPTHLLATIGKVSTSHIQREESLRDCSPIYSTVGAPLWNLKKGGKEKSLAHSKFCLERLMLWLANLGRAELEGGGGRGEGGGYGRD
jgi:hypothetical protein